MKNTIQINIKILVTYSKILIDSDDTMADMLSNKKLNAIVTELFIRGIKLNISFVFITQFYFAMPINIRLNSTHYFITKNYFITILLQKIQKKQELQRITLNNSSEIDFKGFMNLYKKFTAILYSFLVIDVTLASSNP